MTGLACPRCGDRGLVDHKTRHTCRACGLTFEVVRERGWRTCAGHPNCRRQFVPGRSDQRYCSTRCRARTGMRRLHERRRTER